MKPGTQENSAISRWIRIRRYFDFEVDIRILKVGRLILRRLFLRRQGKVKENQDFLISPDLVQTY